MKKIAQKALKKKHPHTPKQAPQTIPNLYLTAPGARNVTDPPGEILIRNYQFPRSIESAMREAQQARFRGLVSKLRETSSGEKMIEILNKPPPLHEHESRLGCTRWVYDSVFMDDGQDRYEPADDISFDVLGTFCPSCELARRLVEFKPVHYTVPAEGETLSASTEGFTGKRWEVVHDPVTNHCTADTTVQGKIFWSMSSDLFRVVLAMVLCAGNYSEVGSLLGGYRCGGRRVFVAELLETRDSQDIDFIENVLRRLSSLEDPRFVSDVSVRITLGEFNPYVMGGGDEVASTPSLTINPASRIIHNLSIRIQMERSEHIFHCPSAGSPYKFGDLANLAEFPETDYAYPRMYTGVGGYAPILAYALLYLNETPPGEFTRIIHEEPSQFYKLCGVRIADTDIKEFRERLMVCKRTTVFTNFNSSIKALRMCLSGLEIKK
jgi:hypothetical protein